MTMDDLGKPALPWALFLHSENSIQGSYSMPFSWAETLCRLNENGATYFWNYGQLLGACTIGMVYKRPYAIIGLMLAAVLYVGGKRIIPVIEKKYPWLLKVATMSFSLGKSING